MLVSESMNKAKAWYRRHMPKDGLPPHDNFQAAFPPNPTTQYALAIPEILEALVRAEPTLAGRRRHLLINKPFFHQAARILWGEGGLDKTGQPITPGIYPLLRIIETDIGRAQLYADYIKSLRFGHGNQLWSPEHRLHGRLRAVSFTGLRSLSMRGHTLPLDAPMVLLPYAHAALNSLTVGTQLRRLDDWCLAQLAAASPCLAQVDIDFTPQQHETGVTATGLASFIESLPQLVTFCLGGLSALAWDDDANLSVLHALAAHPHIEGLRLPRLPDQWVLDDRRLEQQHPFARLQRLTVAYMSTPMVERYFADLGHLRMLSTASACKNSGTKTSSLESISRTPLLAAISSAMPGLSTLSLAIGDKDMELTTEAGLLGSVQQFTSLTKLQLCLDNTHGRIGFQAPPWNDNTIDRLTRVLGPKLRVLSLIWSRQVEGITWRCLVPIAANCPDLKCLDIDARIYWTDFVRTGIVFPLLQHFSHVTDNRTNRDWEQLDIEFDYARVAEQVRRMMPLVRGMRFAGDRRMGVDLMFEKAYRGWVARDPFMCPDCWDELL